MYMFIDLFDAGAFVVLNGREKSSELKYYVADGIYVDKKGNDYYGHLYFKPIYKEDEEEGSLSFDEAIQREWEYYEVFVNDIV